MMQHKQKAGACQLSGHTGIALKYLAKRLLDLLLSMDGEVTGKQRPDDISLVAEMADGSALLKSLPRKRKRDLRLEILYASRL
jgi:hypothetical protein